jgi:glycosyltransferase involved in cell wall biosynthesis
LKKFTIITPSLNRAGMIETAIQSVLDQNYPEIEHIIMDGGSTDGTLVVLKKYPHLRVVSEPDGGMYDAINKGLKLATGDFIGFLNTDDFYAEGAIQTAASIFAGDPEMDTLWGSADIIEKNSNGQGLIRSLFSPGKKEDIVPYLLWVAPIFNACFFSNRVFDRWGLFMPQIKVAGDREFMLRVALGGGNIHTTDTILYHYSAHEDSMTYGNDPIIFERWNQEHCRIAEYYLGQQSIQGEARATYRQMHTISNLSLIKIAIKSGNFTRALGLARQGWRVNPGWPMMLLNRSWKILWNLPRGDRSNEYRRE